MKDIIRVLFSYSEQLRSKFRYLVVVVVVGGGGVGVLLSDDSKEGAKALLNKRKERAQKGSVRGGHRLSPIRKKTVLFLFQ